MPPDTYRAYPCDEEREGRNSTLPSPNGTNPVVTGILDGDLKHREPKLEQDEEELRRIIDLTPQHILVLDTGGTVIFANQPALEYTGLSLREVRASDVRGRVFHPEDVQRLQEERQEGLAGAIPFQNEQRVLGRDGKYRWFLIRYNPLLDKRGKAVRWYATATDVEDRKRTELLRAAEVRTLQMIADGARLTDVLNHVCSSIDFQISPSFTTILLMDTDGKRLWPSAGPKVPNDWARAITPLAVAPDMGLCSTAACLKTRVIVPDLAIEPIFREEYRPIALKNGIRAGWSQPILTRDNQVLGTFAIYSADPRVPTGEDLALIEAAGRIALIAIERQRSQEAVRNAFERVQKSESKLRQVIDTIPALAWCNLPDGLNEFLSKRWHEYTGLSPDESHGWGWQVAFHPEDLPPLMKRWQELLVSGEPGEIEARLRRHDGVYRWFLIRVEPFRDESGQIYRWYGTSTDIEDRKRAEEALKASERDLRSIINTIPTLAWSARPDGSADFLNRRWLDYTGLAAEEAQGWGWGAAIHPDDVKELVEDWQSALASGQPAEAEARMRRCDGAYRWFLFRANPLRDESGKIIKWYGTNVDIEGRKRAEEKLRRSEDFLAEGQRLTLTGSYSWKVATDEITWSEQLYRIYEFDVGVPLTLELIRTRVQPQDISLIEKMKMVAEAAADNDFEWHWRLKMPDHSIKYLHAVAHLTRARDGQQEYIAAVQDVTARHLSEEALSRARSELATVARVTSLGVLTASIAHEVNQPLSGIITNAGTCLRMLSAEPPNVDGARETARRTIRDGNRASDVITRLRTLYSKKDPQPELMELNDTAHEVTSLLLSELQRNRVHLRQELAEDLPPVIGDRIQLQQVIMNLLRNASEAMSTVDDRPRELLIRTELEEGDRVRLSVKDVGVGFAPQVAGKLFDAFFTTKSEGMGIGLSISRSIIDAHHGRLWATANSGPGATFSFSIPCQFKDSPGAEASADRNDAASDAA